MARLEVYHVGVLVRLECARERLRRRSCRSFGRYGNSYFAIALIALFISMLPGPLELITLPFFGIPIALALFFFGLIFVISIVLLPYGLFFW